MLPYEGNPYLNALEHARRKEERTTIVKFGIPSSKVVWQAYDGGKDDFGDVVDIQGNVYVACVHRDLSKVICDALNNRVQCSR